jgi:hypothetical protein
MLKRTRFILIAPFDEPRELRRSIGVPLNYLLCKKYNDTHKSFLISPSAARMLHACGVFIVDLSQRWLLQLSQ